MTPPRDEIFEGLFRRHDGALRRYLARFLPNEQDAAEVAQEAFLKVYFVGDERVEYPRAFLFKTASNLAIDRIRRDRSRRQHLAQALEVEDPADIQPGPEQVLAAKQEFMLLCGAIMKLPPKCRQAFVLHRFYGLSYAEIAAEMGIARHTVERHMVKALARCRRQLEKSSVPEGW